MLSKTSGKEVEKMKKSIKELKEIIKMAELEAVEYNVTVSEEEKEIILKCLIVANIPDNEISSAVLNALVLGYDEVFTEKTIHLANNVTIKYNCSLEEVRQEFKYYVRFGGIFIDYRDRNYKDIKKTFEDLKIQFDIKITEKHGLFKGYKEMQETNELFFYDHNQDKRKVVGIGKDDNITLIKKYDENIKTRLFLEVNL